jgi:hypothetical protein
MRDTSDAHFLHARQGLQAVLRPFVPQPSAIAWIPGREQLLVGCRDGQLHHVDPALGTSLVEAGLGDVAALAIHPDRERYLVINRDGHWVISKMGDRLAEGKHKFAGNIDCLWLGEYAVIVGDTGNGRLVSIVHDREEKAVLPVPDRAAPIRDGDKLAVARSVTTGLEITRLSRGAKFDGEATAHRLRIATGPVLGITSMGVAVWARKTGPALHSLRFPEVTAGDSAPTRPLVALGTRAGGVSLIQLDRRDPQARPQIVKAYDSPVTAVAFADRGRWLATAAESLQLWSWED